MTASGARVVASALAFCAAIPLAAQETGEVTFGGEVFDVTGAGTLDLGDLDAVLKPFRRQFENWTDDVKLELVIDADGAVLDCRSIADEPRVKAGAALCAHAQAVGRFRKDPWLSLDYTRAAYQLTVRQRIVRQEGESQFAVSDAYPLERQAIVFGDEVLPPEDQRLAKADVRIMPMEYPRLALRTHVEARVVAALTFDEAGKVATCRPVTSSNTARIAYETCTQARTKVRLLKAPDPRPYVLIVNWYIGD